MKRHPLLPQYDLLDYCESEDIVVQAHSGLGGGNDLLLRHKTILEVACSSGLSPGQVVLSWNLQQKVPVVTRWSSDQHGKEALALLKEQSRKLSPQEMKAIDEATANCAPHRFVAPPFMYRQGAAYSWGDAQSKK